jgi:hypothetical protein
MKIKFFLLDELNVEDLKENIYNTTNILFDTLRLKKVDPSDGLYSMLLIISIIIESCEDPDEAIKIIKGSLDVMVNSLRKNK